MIAGVLFVVGALLVLNGQGWGVLLLLVAALFGGASRLVAGHGHGNQAAVERHERGHASAAQALGLKHRVRVWNGGGEVTLRRRDVERMSPQDYMAFMKAGAAAEGSVPHGADLQAVREEIRRMRRSGASRGEIAQAMRDSDADARRYARRAQ